MSGNLSCYDITYIVDNDKYMEYFANIMKNHIKKVDIVKDVEKEIKTRKEKKLLKKRLDALLTELANSKYIKYVSTLEKTTQHKQKQKNDELEK